MTSADDSTMQKPKKDPAAPAPADTEDEQHRLFREALERKKSASHGSTGGPAEGGHGAIGRGAGPKTQRMFRRKSG
jgi:hypothetical protein